MTTIGSTSYHTSTSYHAGTGRSNANATYAGASERQEKETKAATALLADPEVPETTIAPLPSTATINLQGKLITLSAIGRGSDLSAAKPIWEWPEDQYREYVETQRGFMEMEKRALEIEHTQYPDTSNDQRLQPYATVVVGGRVVATIDNQGIVGTENEALGQRLQNHLSGKVNGTNGPDLAQARAEQIAKLMGGRVVAADTAMDQISFERLSSLEPQINYDAMERDPRYGALQDQYSDLEDIEKMRAQLLL